MKLFTPFAYSVVELFTSSRYARFFCALVMTVAAVSVAHADMTQQRPKIIVQSKVFVRSSNITLNSIASISYTHAEHEMLVRALESISLGDAPPPRMNVEIPGEKILSAIKKAGISLHSIGYSIPRVVTVEREGRILKKEEVLSEARAVLAKDSMLDVQVRDVRWSGKQVLPSGETKIDIERVGLPNRSEIPLRVTVSVDQVPASRFLATAVVDDWKEIPVLSRTVERGMLISPEDVELVRMNLLKQPNNVVELLKSVIGKRAKRRMRAGNTIQRDFIDIPPIISRGARVTMIFESGGLQATASGLAVEDGYENGEIQVKNESSRRIVRARVINSEEVKVERR